MRNRATAKHRRQRLTTQLCNKLDIDIATAAKIARVIVRDGELAVPNIMPINGVTHTWIPSGCACCPAFSRLESATKSIQWKFFISEALQ